MLKFSPLFVQKILCFVQIPKVFVQKHETKTAETEKNDSNVRGKRQQYPRKTYPKVLRTLYKSMKQKQQKPDNIRKKIFQNIHNSTVRK